MSKVKIRILICLFFILQLSSCTTVEVATNLGKKIVPQKVIPDFKQQAIFKIGSPYQVEGVTYYPKKDLQYDETGIASWYGPKFHGRLTANGEIFNQNNITAAHKTLPLPSAVKVTNLENGLSIIVRINDRGPFVNQRIIDLSAKAAEKIQLKQKGTGLVRVQLLRSESLLLEKLAKKGKFPEIHEIKKLTIPPVNKPKKINVKVVDINKKNKQELDPKVESIKRRLKVLELNDKKFKIWIQIAAFSNIKSAKILKEKFELIENINIHKVFLKGKYIYRVRVGPFLSIDKADSVYNFLIAKGMQGTKFIVE